MGGWKHLVRAIFGPSRPPVKTKRKPMHAKSLASSPPPTLRVATPPPALPPPRATKVPKEVPPLKQLLEAVQLLCLLAEHRASLPIVGCCKLGRGEIEATNLETSLTLPLPWLEIAPVCVPAPRLLKVLRNLSGSLHLEKRGEDLVVNGSFVLPGISADEWPVTRPQQLGEAVGPAFQIPTRWEDLIPAISPDTSRLALSGVCIDLPHGQCAASDGHRLHVVALSRSEPQAFADEGAWEYCTVPAVAAKLLARMVKKGTVTGRFYLARRELTTHMRETLAKPASDPSRVALEQELRRPALARFVNGGELWTRLLEVQFPDYHQVTTIRGTPARVVFDTPHLLRAMKSCVAMTHERSRGVKLQAVQEGAMLTYVDGEGVKVDLHVACRGWALGQRVGFNCRYVTELLGCVQKPEVEWLLQGEQMPIHIRDGDFRAVVMPMRILGDEAVPKPSAPAAAPDIPDDEPSPAEEIESLEEDLQVVNGEIEELREDMRKAKEAEERSEMEDQLTDLLENKHALEQRLKELRAQVEEGGLEASAG